MGGRLKLSILTGGRIKLSITENVQNQVEKEFNWKEMLPVTNIKQESNFARYLPDEEMSKASVLKHEGCQHL